LGGVSPEISKYNNFYSLAEAKAENSGKSLNNILDITKELTEEE